MDYKSEILKSLAKEDRDNSIELALETIEKGIFTIPYLYENVLKTSLYDIDNCQGEDCIWKEHKRTSIVRTIIECVYPYIIKKKKTISPMGKLVLLLCPEKEYHEIGIKMVSDFFILNGYETIFIGTNTPREQVQNAIIRTNPDYLALSVTDYYLLFEAKKIIDGVKEIPTSLKILVGGNAFKNNPEIIKVIGADLYLETYEDTVSLREGDLNEISF